MLDVAVALRGLLAVNASTLHRFAFPCCAHGGACCPADARNKTHACCSHHRVSQWLDGVVAHGGADLQWFTRTTWYDEHWHTFSRVKNLIHLQGEIQRRGVRSGLSYNSAPGPATPRPMMRSPPGKPPMTAEERQHALKLLKAWRQERDAWFALRRRS